MLFLSHYQKRNFKNGSRLSHRHPFDRMIMTQAELENLPVITYDEAFQTGLIQIIP
jgi:PIN domain nuclease of toxin-antitoxin system